MKDFNILNIEELLELDFSQLSNDNLFYLYREYIKNQNKYGMHLIRLLLFGIEILDTGAIKFPTDWAKYLVQIKQCQWSLSHVIDKANYLEQQLENAFNHTKLPEHPNLEEINKLQIKLIEEHWGNEQQIL